MPENNISRRQTERRSREESESYGESGSRLSDLQHRTLDRAAHTEEFEGMLATIHKLQEMLSAQEHKHSEQLQAIRDHMAEKDAENRQKTHILESQLSESIGEYENRQHQLLSAQNQLKALTVKQTLELEAAKKKYTQEFRELLQSTSNEYIDTTVSAHTERKKDLEKSFSRWAKFGASAVIVGIFLLCIMAFSINPLDEKLTPSAITYLSVRSTVLMALVLVLAKYCYAQSQQALTESLRVASRINAIEFGAFYLKTYGANTEWKELRDVFRGWEGVSINNDANNNPASKLDSPIDWERREPSISTVYPE